MYALEKGPARPGYSMLGVHAGRVEKLILAVRPRSLRGKRGQRGLLCAPIRKQLVVMMHVFVVMSLPGTDGCADNNRVNLGAHGVP